MNPAIDISSVILKTDSLTLRPWNESDLGAFFEYASVPGVGEMAGWKHHESQEETKAILNLFMTGKNVFCLDINGKAIGSLGIEKYDEKEFPELANKRGRELGFVISKEYWGRGLAKEALDAATSYLFNNEKLDFVICGYFEWNHQSKRVQEKCGFAPIKEIQYRTKMGSIEAAVASILTKEDFFSKKP